MGIRIISFTKKGIELSKRLAEVLGNEDVVVFTKCSVKSLSMIRHVEESIGEWTGKQMTEKHTLLFIGACGIAVRAIAPCVKDKLHDSAVLVIDEEGNYIIPLLSGHVGGANEMAERISLKIGAIPVITTATDINNKFAIDLFAKRNGLHIENKEGIAKVSSKILAGKDISMAVETGRLEENVHIPLEVKIIPSCHTKTLSGFSEFPADVVITTGNEMKGELLTLRPKEYIIGIGCKRGKEEDKIHQFITKNLQEADISIEQIMAVASIDKKKEENGLVTWCRKRRIPFWTYSAEQLQELKGDFSASDFVKEQVGVDNVCERAALYACNTGGSLVYRKHAEDGMTIAVAKREWRIKFDEK